MFSVPKTGIIPYSLDSHFAFLSSSSACLLSDWVLHDSGIIEPVSLGVSKVLNMFLKFMQIVACINISFLFMGVK